MEILIIIAIGALLELAVALMCARALKRKWRKQEILQLQCDAVALGRHLGVQNV